MTSYEVGPMTRALKTETQVEFWRKQYEQALGNAKAGEEAYRKLWLDADDRVAELEAEIREEGTR